MSIESAFVMNDFARRDLAAGREIWLFNGQRWCRTQHTRVSLGKAAHRCHGWLPCLDGCVLTTRREVLRRWTKDDDGNWTKGTR